MSEAASYPASAAARDRWILDRRPARNALEPSAAHDAFVEDEPSGAGRTVPVATIFLTNRECPWRCLMCDLWKNTHAADTPRGAIPEQIRAALATLPPVRRVKLYNSGSFFDPRAVPPEDLEPVAGLVRRFERVVVESHPALAGDSCLRFRDVLAPATLEVALGLETAHPEVLDRLNKRMTVESFARAARFLREAGIALRVFVLVGLPFLGEKEGLEWTRRSVEVSFDCGAAVVSLIPTRAGNGAMDDLVARGEFAPPTLAALERATADGIVAARGLVLADLWNLDRLRACRACFPARASRLRAMNLAQALLPRIACPDCGGSA